MLKPIFCTKCSYTSSLHPLSSTTLDLDNGNRNPYNLFSHSYQIYTVFDLLRKRPFFTSLAMPRAERVQKEATMKVKKLGQASDQTKISGFFSIGTLQPINEEGRILEESKANEFDGPLEGNIEQTEGEEMPIVSDPWIRNKATFSTEEKMRSVNSGRYFQADWLESHHWLQYHGQKRAASCSICTVFRQPRDNSPFIFRPTAQGFRNWRKGVERMAEHAQSDCHRSVEKSLKKENEIPDIGCMLDDQMKELHKKRRE